MQSTLDEFYEMESGFCDWIERGEKFSEIKKEISERLSKLEESLTEEQSKLLKTLALLYYRLEVEAEKSGYKAGFKTGLALALEALDR